MELKKSLKKELAARIGCALAQPFPQIRETNHNEKVKHL